MADIEAQLTELAFRLPGNDRFLVLEAASKLRQWEAWRVKQRQSLDLI